MRPLQEIAAGYATEGAALELGTVLIDGVVDPTARVRIPFATLNRHGLVAGATGTGKTKTLQGLAEQLSNAGRAGAAGRRQGRPVRDVAAGGEQRRRSSRGRGTPATTGRRPRSRSSSCRWAGRSSAVPIRATLTQFGPILLSKVLDLNDTQESTLGLIFHWADQRSLPLLDTKDLRAVIQHLTSDEGKADLKGIGGVSSATAGVILRALVNLEAQGGEDFFGEPEFEPADLMRQVDGKGIVTLLELADQAGNPRLFSTFLMWLLAELFEDLPEAGDLDKPKLVFFFDEAHLLFTDASKAFLERIEQTVKLIRSKGVGVFFCTQLPTDIPNDGALPARRADPARAARVHPGGPGGAGQDGAHLPDHQELRHRGGADLARHRRGDHHRALRAGRADAGGVGPDAGAALVDGRDRAGRGDAPRPRGRRCTGGTGRPWTASRPTSGSPRGSPSRRRRRRAAAAREPEPERRRRASGRSRAWSPSVLGSPVVKSFLRSAASALGREITRGMFGTRRRR